MPTTEQQCSTNGSTDDQTELDINQLAINLVREMPVNVLKEALLGLPTETIKVLQSAIRQEVHNRNKPVKRGTNVPPDEKPRLTTKGTIPIDIVQKANAELVKFDMKILTPRVANKSRDYRYIHVGKYYRLLSKDAGETWQLMSFADFERHMK